MRNLESLAELKKQGKMRIEERRDNFVRQSLLSDDFLDLIQRNKKPFDLLMCYYECAIMEVETKFKVLNQEHSLEYDRNPIESIKTRVKSYESILKKIRKKDIPITKDYIKNPKPSGYRSLHLIVQVPIFLQNTKKFVNVEVQFRTIAMDFWASLEHKMRYKKDIPESQVKFLQEELYDCAEQSAKLDERMQGIRDVIGWNKNE